MNKSKEDKAKCKLRNIANRNKYQSGGAVPGSPVINKYMAKRKSKKIKSVEEMTITDILQLPLFFENAKKDLADVWNKIS